MEAITIADNYMYGHTRTVTPCENSSYWFYDCGEYYAASRVKKALEEKGFKPEIDMDGFGWFVRVAKKERS